MAILKSKASRLVAVAMPFLMYGVSQMDDPLAKTQPATQQVGVVWENEREPLYPSAWSTELVQEPGEVEIPPPLDIPPAPGPLETLVEANNPNWFFDATPKESTINPLDLIYGIGKTESGMNPEVGCNPSNACGLMQLRPDGAAQGIVAVVSQSDKYNSFQKDRKIESKRELIFEHSPYLLQLDQFYRSLEGHAEQTRLEIASINDVIEIAKVSKDWDSWKENISARSSAERVYQKIVKLKSVIKMGYETANPTAMAARRKLLTTMGKDPGYSDIIVQNGEEGVEFLHQQVPEMQGLIDYARKGGNVKFHVQVADSLIAWDLHKTNGDLNDALALYSGDKTGGYAAKVQGHKRNFDKVQIVFLSK